LITEFTCVFLKQFLNYSGPAVQNFRVGLSAHASLNGIGIKLGSQQNVGSYKFAQSADNEQVVSFVAFQQFICKLPPPSINLHLLHIHILVDHDAIFGNHIRRKRLVDHVLIFFFVLAKNS
jgi:hypothetical protein